MSAPYEILDLQSGVTAEVIVGRPGLNAIGLELHQPDPAAPSDRPFTVTVRAELTAEEARRIAGLLEKAVAYETRGES